MPHHETWQNTPLNAPPHSNGIASGLSCFSGARPRTSGHISSHKTNPPPDDPLHDDTKAEQGRASRAPSGHLQCQTIKLGGTGRSPRPQQTQLDLGPCIFFARARAMTDPNLLPQAAHPLTPGATVFTPHLSGHQTPSMPLGFCHARSNEPDNPCGLDALALWLTELVGSDQRPPIALHRHTRLVFLAHSLWPRAPDNRCQSAPQATGASPHPNNLV